MPLPPASCSRIPQHIRQINYRSYVRTDGLWDIEGELIDTKAVDFAHPTTQQTRKAGDPIHHLHIRLTVDTQLQVHAIEAIMDVTPLHECPAALTAMQRMVGCSMRRGWRKSIETHLTGISGCTHLRELLLNMATAAFQSITSAFSHTTDLPPSYVGHCTGWNLNGPAVAKHFPRFAGWIIPQGKRRPEPPQPDAQSFTKV